MIHLGACELSRVAGAKFTVLVRIGVVPTGPTPRRSQGVYGEVSGLGDRSGEDEGEQGGHEGAEYVREFVAGAGREAPDQAIRDRAQERRYRYEDGGWRRLQHPEGESERGGEAGCSGASQRPWQRDSSLGTWRDFLEGCNKAWSSTEKLSYLGLCRVCEGCAEGGDEGGDNGLRSGRGGEDGAEGGDGAVGQGVAGAAASAVFLGCAGTLLAAVAEPGQKGASDYEQGEDGEASWSQGGVDRGPDQKSAQDAAPADHPERVGEGSEGPGYQEGGQELGDQVFPTGSRVVRGAGGRSARTRQGRGAGGLVRPYRPSRRYR